MEERCLKKISISIESNESLFNDLKELRNIELWNSKSKIVNENIRTISKPVKFVSFVNPIHTPIWAIIDKPYNVFSADEHTLGVFQTLVNYSEIEQNIANKAILTTISETLFIMFYIEVNNEVPSVRCLVLEINFTKIEEVLSRKDVTSLEESLSYFIDEMTAKKDEMIDTLLRQRNDKAHINRMKLQKREDSAKDQQFRIVKTRQVFKKIINREVKRRMATRSKISQIEVGEICFKSMTFKYKTMENVEEKDEKDVKDWLNVLLSLLGV